MISLILMNLHILSKCLWNACPSARPSVRRGKHPWQFSTSTTTNVPSYNASVKTKYHIAHTTKSLRVSGVELPNPEPNPKPSNATPSKQLQRNNSQHSLDFNAVAQSIVWESISLNMSARSLCSERFLLPGSGDWQGQLNFLESKDLVRSNRSFGESPQIHDPRNPAYKHCCKSSRSSIICCSKLLPLRNEVR